MALGTMLGFSDPISSRAACVGYLIPIRAHTLWGVLLGAVAGGAHAPTRDLSAFERVAPYPPPREIDPDDNFWQAIADRMGESGGG